MHIRHARPLGPPHRAPLTSTARFFADALDRHRAPGRLLQIAIPAPAASPDVLLRTLDLPDGFLYKPPRSEACSGIGVAARLEARGAARTQALRAEAQALFDRIDRCAWPDTPAPPPRLHGGLAFGIGGNDLPPWEAFGDGAFILPRWYFCLNGKKALLIHSVDPRAPDARQRSLAELDLLWEALEADAAAPPRPPPPPAVHDPATIEQLDFETWRAQVDTIRQVIRDGQFQKIVAARRSVVQRGSDFDDLQVFERLSLDYPNCNLFLFRRLGSTFLGASPENLCVKRGPQLLTHALAGSREISRHPEADGPPAAHYLLESAKDGWEHEVVVRQIVESLEPLAVSITHPDGPEVVQVRDILHLNTPIRATLLQSAHLLDVVDALHPTSAVGGVPRWESVRWIQEHEGMGRGWYAGPVGWFDAEGDGEFLVAIRSGLLQGNRAYLFAGAGIVEASDPKTEYDETALKQQPMLRALGLDG